MTYQNTVLCTMVIFGCSLTTASTITSFWSSGSQTHATEKETPLVVRAEPHAQAKTLYTLDSKQSFEVMQGDWVKIKTAEGKEGWSLVKDIEKNIQSAYAASMGVEIHGNDKHYQVKKISAETIRKQQEAQAKRMQRYWRQWQRPWSSPFWGMDDDDAVEKLEQKVQALESQLQQLKK